VKEGMESGAEHYARRAEAARVIKEAVDRVRSQFGIDAEVEETPDIVLIKLKNADGSVARTIGLMKDEHLPINGHRTPVERIVEARMRFPNMDVEDAVAQIGKEQAGA